MLTSLRSFSSRLLCLAFALCLGPLAICAAEPGPDTVPCPACRGAAICSARACKDGTTACKATCIKRDGPGWIKKTIEGHPGVENWMAIPYRTATDSGTQYFSPAHIGELIEIENGRPVTRGQCPTCKGTTRVPCIVCQGSGKCLTCAGAGKFIRNVSFFTLTDAQTRPLDAVIRSRQATTITVMRLADQKTFDLPLDKLSSESRELIEQHFPAPAPAL
jgi:hypothetical protein